MSDVLSDSETPPMMMVKVTILYEIAPQYCTEDSVDLPGTWIREEGVRLWDSRVRWFAMAGRKGLRPFSTNTLTWTRTNQRAHRHAHGHTTPFCAS